MAAVVYATTPFDKPARCAFYNAVDPQRVGYSGMDKARQLRPTFIRQWRNHRGYSLERLAEMVPMDKGNLSKIERGKLPYNQELLERIADALMTDPASLLMRDPTDKDAIWSLWERASPGERRQIESVVAALVEDRGSADRKKVV